MRVLLCSLVIVVGAAGCPNDPAGCEAICDWYLQFGDEDRDTCLDDCAWQAAEKRLCVFQHLPGSHSASSETRPRRTEQDC